MLISDIIELFGRFFQLNGCFAGIVLLLVYSADVVRDCLVDSAGVDLI